MTTFPKPSRDPKLAHRVLAYFAKPHTMEQLRNHFREQTGQGQPAVSCARRLAFQGEIRRIDRDGKEGVYLDAKLIEVTEVCAPEDTDGQVCVTIVKAGTVPPPMTLAPNSVFELARVML